MSEKELFEKNYKWNYLNAELNWCDVTKSYKDLTEMRCWSMWQASASREGYKLVPVDVLERSIGHISIALCHPSTSKMEEHIMQRDMDIIDNVVMVTCDG